jgi:hypothetical protein
MPRTSIKSSPMSLVMPPIMPCLAACTAICSFAFATQAADLAIPPHPRAAVIETTSPAAATEVTGSVSTRASTATASAPVAAVSSHALAARARFIEARALMERDILLRDRASKSEIQALEAQVTALNSELDAVERSHQPGAAALADAASSLARDWHQQGLKIVNPPAEGLLELPLPTSVSRKAEAVAVAIDQLVEKVATAGPPPRSVQVKGDRSKGLNR